MSKIKTKIENTRVRSFLEEKFSKGISNLVALKGGEGSQAFSFDTPGQGLVVRFNSNSPCYEKDKYAFEHFSSYKIPLPEVLDIGQTPDEYYYAISTRVEGQLIMDLSDDAYGKLFQELIETLDRIHTIDISKSNGFGKWEVDGRTETSTWRDYLLAVQGYVEAKDNKPSLYETSFLERDIWEKGYGKMNLLLPYCPEERYLIHGDYGSDNVIVNNGKIAGVLDWVGSKYGDFLYDIAWLNFFNERKNPIEKFVRYYKDKQIKNFFERVMCYQLRISLSSLSFYAFSDQREKYEITKNKLLAIVNKYE